MEPPDGYHYTWRKDDKWTTGPGFAKCRMPKCRNAPVATFYRFSFALQKTRPYAYCAEHLYGRRIMNGVVMHRILVPNCGK